MTTTHYRAYGHRNDMGYAVIRKNTGADFVNYGRGFLVKLYTDAGTFVRFAGTWRLLRDARQEAASLGFTTIRRQ